MTRHSSPNRRTVTIRLKVQTIAALDAMARALRPPASRAALIEMLCEDAVRAAPAQPPPRKSRG